MQSKPIITIHLAAISNAWHLEHPTDTITYTPILTDYVLIEQNDAGEWVEPDPFKTGARASWHSFDANHSITLGAGRSWKEAASIAKRYFEHNTIGVKSVEIDWMEAE
jgi:hypothetical protein